jgi:DNA-binding PadR family transcriptional regulator
MSVVRLLVLGMVRRHGRAHGYAIQRELAAWRIETWTRVRPGSIYHALKQLTKEGRLVELGVEDSAKGPGRTLYGLTADGEIEFRQRLEASLGSFDPEELGAGMAFLQALPRARALDLLRDQHRRAVENRDHLDALAPQFPDRAAAPHTGDLLALWSGGLSAVSAWSAGLIARLEAGEYRMDGEGGRPSA